MKKNSSWKIIIVTSLIVTAVLLVWLFKDLIILVLSLLLFILFYFFDEIMEKIRGYRLLTHEQKSPLSAAFLLEQAWNLLQKMIHEKQIVFPITEDTFYNEAKSNSYWENQGATAVIRIHENLSTEIQDEYILTNIAQQALENEKRSPLGKRDQKLQRIILEKIESKDGFLIIVFHDKNFKTVLKDTTAEDLNHDIYGSKN